MIRKKPITLAGNKIIFQK